MMDFDNNLISYGEKNITIIIDGNNDPWFSGNDVSDILKYKDSSRSVRKLVERSDKKNYKRLEKYITNKNIKIPQNKIFINESGLYSLMLSSRMKEAKKFKKWITSDLLPKLRSHGYPLRANALPNKNIIFVREGVTTGSTKKLSIKCFCFRIE